MGAFFTRLFSRNAHAPPALAVHASYEEPLIDVLPNPYLSYDVCNDDTDDDYACWICHDGDDIEKLFYSPCHCNTVIHLSCMFKWYAHKTRLTLNEDTKTHTAHVQCEVCHGDMSDEFAPIIIMTIKEVQKILNSDCVTKPNVCYYLSAAYLETLVGRR